MPQRPFARVPRVDSAPGRCVRCPRDTDLLDLGAEGIRDYGVVYLCTVCFAELADNMRLVGRDEMEEARQNHLANAKHLIAQRDELEVSLRATEAVITTFEEGLSRGVHDLVDRLGRDLVLARSGGSEPADVVDAADDDIPVIYDERVPRGTVILIPAGDAEAGGEARGDAEADYGADGGDLEDTPLGGDVWEHLAGEFADAADLETGDDAELEGSDRV